MKNFETAVISIKHLVGDCAILEVEKPRNFIYSPGQWVYLCPDQAGTQYLPMSIASSPTESTLVFLFREGLSAFKRTLQTLVPNNHVILRLPDIKPLILFDKSLLLIAGGIGISPCRSIIKYAVDTDFDLGINLLCINRTTLIPYDSDINILISGLNHSEKENITTHGLQDTQRQRRIETFVKRHRDGCNTYEFGPPKLLNFLNT